jgi:hypothetical protein
MTTTQHEATASTAVALHHEPRLRGWCGILVGGLLLQVVLGAANVAFLTLPDGGGAEAASPAWLLAVHAYIGVAVLIGSVVVVVLAARSGSSSWLTIAVIGLLGVLTSLVSGHLFVTHDDERASMLMAVGCVVALTSYVVGVSRRGRV